MRRIIDIYHRDIVTDWKAVKTDNVDGVFAKSTEGVTVQDERFHAFLLGARSVQLPLYPYHFYRPLDKGLDQFQNFITATQNLGIKRMALDLEFCPHNLKDQWSQVDEADRYTEVEAFCDAVEKTGMEIKIYTSYEFIVEFMPRATFLGKYGLWLARYEANPGPVPAIWKDGWEFWQYSEHGTIAGVQGDVDMSWVADTVNL